MFRDTLGPATRAADESETPESARKASILAKYRRTYHPYLTAEILRAASAAVGDVTIAAALPFARRRASEHPEKGDTTALAHRDTVKQSNTHTNTIKNTQEKTRNDGQQLQLHNPKQSAMTTTAAGAEGLERHPLVSDDTYVNSPLVNITQNSKLQLVQRADLNDNSGGTNDFEDSDAKHHKKWKLMRVIAGHQGWVKTLAVDHSNSWFASAGADRVIKIWDLASGTLKLTLTGHISTVSALAISNRHPYMFSAGNDKMLKCWDLETNKVIRNYHGHLSGIYSLALHPTLDVIVSGGRDSTARVWDMRTKAQVFALTGHRGTVSSIQCQDVDPQVVTGGMDSTVKLWDLAAGKVMETLTHHRKGVRSVALHPTDFAFASGSADAIKQFKLPEGEFLRDFAGHNEGTIVNTISLNEDGVVFAGCDNGKMTFCDWESGDCFQQMDSLVQPGSLQEAEASVYCSTFDMTGSRLITGEADKTIKVFKEVD